MVNVMLIEQKARVYRNKAGSHVIIKSPYNGRLVDAIKAIPGAKWNVNGEKKYWSLPIEHYEAAKEVVRPFYQIEGEESFVTWRTVRATVRFEQHKTRTVRKYGKAVLIDGTDLINVDYGNVYKYSSDFDILEEQGGFVQGDEKSPYWAVEYTLLIKMRSQAVVQAVSGTYEEI